VAGACACGDEYSSSMKCGEFVDWLKICKLLKKGCAPWSELDTVRLAKDTYKDYLIFR
jgi:hypothetical protein